MSESEDEVRGEEAAGGAEVSGEAPKLNLGVQVAKKSACERHVTVTVPREDIDRYFDNSYSELMGKAEVPGFRHGRAPRKLVEARFRKDVGDQVKMSLLMDSMTQISEDGSLSPISEPDFDPVAVSIPDEGPMTFEFDIEVRPEFDLPKWQGLSIERATHEFTDAEVEKQLKDLLARRGRLVPFDGAAQAGDYVTVNLAFQDADGKEISSAKEETIRIRPVLSFRDGKVERFDKLMKGVKAGETREGEARLSADAPNESLRGKTIKAVFEVLEVKKLELPQLTPALLEELGGFGSEAELRDAVKEQLERRLQYEQQRRAREQVLAALTVAANWDLPPELLRRQARRELERSVLELRRSGFSDSEIRAHENELRQNSSVATARALKEHFILERIAEDEKIEDLPEDYDLEIELIAQQTGDSARRTRAQLEKRGLMDALRNQIIERKAIDLILSHAKFKDVPFKMEGTEAEALDQAVGGEEEEADIPEAKHSGGAESLKQPQERG
ncbi:MAG TPA: trigger factor [Pirellulales bacterium]|nr:trigger factor [Pirellulales bacterium]